FISFQFLKRGPRDALHCVKSNTQFTKRLILMLLLHRTNSKLGRLKIAYVSEEMSSCHWIGENGPELPQIFGIGDSLFIYFLDYSVDDRGYEKLLANAHQLTSPSDSGTRITQLRESPRRLEDFHEFI